MPKSENLSREGWGGFAFFLSRFANRYRSEVAEAQVSQEEVQKYLKSGGMPGIFAVRDDEVRTRLLDDWIDLVVRRDIHEFRNLRLEGDVCHEFLRLCCHLEEPSQAEIARNLKLSTRMAHNAYFESKRASFLYYRSKAKTLIHLIERHPDRPEVAFQCMTQEVIKKTDVVLMQSFLNKNQKSLGVILAPVLEPTTERLGISIKPWSAILQ